MLDILTPIQQGLQIRGTLQDQARQRELAPIEKEMAGLNLGDLRRQGVTSSDATRMASLISGAKQLSVLPDNQKLPFLLQRRQQLESAGIPTMDTDEAIGMAQAGDFQGLQQLTDRVLSLEPKQASRAVSTEILKDGTTIQGLSTGGTLVTGPTGEVLTGQKAADAIEKARQSEIDLAGQLAGIREKEKLAERLEKTGIIKGTEEAAKQAIKTSGDFFEKSNAVAKNMNNLDEGIRLIDSGAKSGAVERLFPSIKAATIELDNLRNQLGLDVVGATTFGALSEGELKLALDTALPTKLDEKELRDWLERKKAAQQKLLNEFNQAAVFLGTPGNTIADFMKMKVVRGDQGSGLTSNAAPKAPTNNENTFTSKSGIKFTVK